MTQPVERRRNSRFTPDGDNFDSALNIMFLAGFPLLLWVFQGSFAGVLTGLLEIWLFAMALRLISRGQKAQQVYDRASVARKPRFPRKVMGSVLIGIMVMVLAGYQFGTVVVPVLIGVLGAGLSLTAFGVDPMKDKGLDDPDMLAQMETDAAIERLHTQLTHVADQVAELQDAELTRRTEAAREVLDQLLDAVAHNPAAYARLRTPIVTYADLLGEEAGRLMKAAESEKFPFARRRYVAKLDVMAESFARTAQTKGFLSKRDAFEQEADNLLDRMPQESAA